MTPTFFDFFKSAYYSNTYLPPIDLSDKALQPHLFDNNYPNSSTMAKVLISKPEVQQVLSSPLTYDMIEKAPLNKIILERNDFKLLSRKTNILNGQEIAYYSVVEHPQLPGWIIKAGGDRITEGELNLGPMNDRQEMAFFTKEEALLRIEMAQRIKTVAKEMGVDVVIPEKKLVAYQSVSSNATPTQKYCVVCQKIDVLSDRDTANKIKAMEDILQTRFAFQLSNIVQKAGIVDASFSNIRLTKDNKIAFIDTEPCGLLVAKQKWTSPKRASVEKCARIGLYTLMNQTLKGMLGTATSRLDSIECEQGLEPFHFEVKKAYDEAAVPKFSKWKIALSIATLGVVAIINAIVALVKMLWTQYTFARLQKIDKDFMENASSMGENELMTETLEYKNKRFPIAQLYFSLVDGVPLSQPAELIPV